MRPGTKRTRPAPWRSWLFALLVLTLISGSQAGPQAAWRAATVPRNNHGPAFVVPVSSRDRAPGAASSRGCDRVRRKASASGAAASRRQARLLAARRTVLGARPLGIYYYLDDSQGI